MPDNINERLSELKARCEANDALAEQQNAVRGELMQAQVRLRAMELQAQQVAEELQSLEGFSLFGLLASLSGGKSERVAEMRETHDGLCRERDDCGSALKSMEREANDLARQVEAAVNAQDEYNALLSEKRQQMEATGNNSSDRLAAMDAEVSDAKLRVRAVEKAMELCGDAMRDLNDEIETTSMLGRCRVAEGNKALRGLMANSRKRTTGDCAKRVSDAIARFLRKVSEIRAKDEGDMPEAWGGVEESLAGIAEKFDGKWLKPEATEPESAAHAQEQLQTAALLLEKWCDGAREKAEGARSQQQACLESM